MEPEKVTFDERFLFFTVRIKPYTNVDFQTTLIRLFSIFLEEELSRIYDEEIGEK